MARRVVPLTEGKIKALKPKDKIYNEADGHGLYVWVTPVGSKIFKFHYTNKLTKKRNMLTIGNCSEVTLDDARSMVANFNRVVKSGKVPRLKEEFDFKQTFAVVALEYMDHQVQHGEMKPNTRDG